MTPPAQPERAHMTISCPDGLAHALSEQNLRLQQIVHEHKLREDMLLREIHDMRMVLLKKRCPNCKCNQTNTNDEQSSVADNVENASICSWEAVDDRSAPTSSGSSSIQQSQQQTNTASVLWVPDHAVKRCTNCQNEFWIGRRRHHCRSCGQIFCADCSEFWAPLPDAKLFKPVRLCGPCYLAVTTRLEQQSTSLIINNMPNYTTSLTTGSTTNTTLVATTVWTTKGGVSSQQLPELGEPVVANTAEVTTTTVSRAKTPTTNTPASNNNMSIAQIPIATAAVLQPEQQQPKQSHSAPTAKPVALAQTSATTNGATNNLPQHVAVNAVVAVTTTSTSASGTIFKTPPVPITAAADALQQQQQQQRQNAAAAAATASATVAAAAAAATNSQIESSSMSHMMMAANKNIAASVAN